MRIITELSNNFKQQLNILTEDKQGFTFFLEYLQGQEAWFYSLVYNNFSISGQRLVLDPNFLRRFKGALPFGLVCSTEGLQVDPYLLDDFSNGRIQIFLLNQAEVAALEVGIYGT